MESTWDTSLDLEIDPAAESRRRVRRAFVASAVAHAVLVLLLAVSPAPEPMVLPAALTVDLVARAPSVAPAAPKPAPRAAPAPAPTPKPVEAVPAPPPPQARILPKSAPETAAKPKPAPPQVKRRPRPKEMELGDAMAALRSELGESAPAAIEREAAESAAVDASETGDANPKEQGGVTVSPEVRAWIAATRRHVQSVWINPQEFLNRGYVTELRVDLRADGTVVGRPEVLRSSGDPYADDNAVRALLKASPLPPPPAAGSQIFIFVPEA